MNSRGTKLAELIERGFAEGAELRLVLAEITTVAQEIAIRASRSQGLQGEDAEDVAQATALKLVIMLEDGRRPGNADAFVWRIAWNAALDVHRAQKRDAAKAKRVGLEYEAQRGWAEDAEALWLKREGQELAHATVRDALSRAPENYRVALEKHLDGVAVEFVADEHYAAMVAAGEVNVRDAAAVVAARKKARNRADQHLKRGRDWLRKQLLATAAEVGSTS